MSRPRIRRDVALLVRTSATEATGDQLGYENQQGNAGDVEEAVQVDVQASPHEEDPEERGQQQPRAAAKRVVERTATHGPGQGRQEEHSF